MDGYAAVFFFSLDNLPSVEGNEFTSIQRWNWFAYSCFTLFQISLILSVRVSQALLTGS